MATYIKAGTYPLEKDMISEMDALNKVFEKHKVKVYRPKTLKKYNQIFSRDIAFVIEDKIIRANILPNREEEVEAISSVWNLIDEEKRFILPSECHVEGGDVMLWNDYIFIGTYSAKDYPDYITARTNLDAVIAIQELFPHKTVKAFELRKSNTNPKENALHLDCCFQPIGKDKAILHRNGFLVDHEYEWLVNFFGKDNIFEIEVWTDETKTEFNPLYVQFQEEFNTLLKEVIEIEYHEFKLNDFKNIETSDNYTIFYKLIQVD